MPATPLKDVEGCKKTWDKKERKQIWQGSSYDTLAAGQLHEFFLVFKYDILYIKLA